MKKTIHLKESELKRMIAESVKRLILKEGDTRIMKLKREADESLAKCLQIYNNTKGYNFSPQVKIERDSNGFAIIAVHLPQEQIKAIQYDQKIYDDFRKLAKYMNRCGFTLTVGPLMGDVLWEYAYDNDNMQDMWNKHMERFNKKVIRENIEDWYAEEDYNGNTGNKGEVRSYNVGYISAENAEADAQEYGYQNLADYLKYLFNEIQPECPWTWQKLGNGYGYHGNIIFDENGVVCKEIYGQIMFDEYPKSNV